MSALNAGQAALKVVYCYDPGTGVPETKGGVAWKLGNDTTGDGRSGDVAGAPYATPEQAWEEIRAFEGQELVTQDWELRFLTDDDEASAYGTITHNSDTTYPSTDQFIFTFRGWLKEWGDQLYGDQSGRWASQAHKPEFSNFQRTITSNLHGPKLMEWKDIRFVNNSANLADVAIRVTLTQAILDSVRIRYYGCSHSGTSTKAGNTHVGTTSHPIATSAAEISYSHSQFFDCSIHPFDNIFAADNDTYFHVNCYYHNTTKNILVHNWAGAINTRTETLNCIFNLDGVGLLCHDNNVGSSDISNVLVRDNNRYWLRNSADFAKWNSALPVESSFSPSANYDLLSSEGDPDIVSDADPSLNNSSLILDKGSIPEVLSFHTDALSSNDYQDYDCLNFLWGDSVDPSTATSANGNALFSQRGVGPCQNALGMLPPIAEVASPKNVITFSPVYLAAKVTDDPDGVGTVQPRFLQASNIDMDTDLVILDAWPLNITTSDNKINFTEDGGAERTATLTVGVYNTVTVLAEIKTQMEAAPSATGTYTPTYNSGTQKMSIAVSGAITNFVILAGTGTDIANFFYRWSGFRPVDTGSAASHEADDTVLENFYDAARVYEFSTDYDGVSDPAVSGIWNDLGTGDPSDSGVEGTGGVDAEGIDRWVRTDFNNKSPMNDNYHDVKFSSGTFKSSPVGPT